MEIKKAPRSGFCFGVKMAIQKGEELIQKGQGPIATLGPLIHNPQEINRLDLLGIHSRERFEDICEKKVLIRTHGVAPEVYEEAKRRNLEIFDCTCPFVRKVQQIAYKHSQLGYLVLILGNKKHPEVEGILGWAGKRGFAFSDVSELSWMNLRDEKICLVSQTTENINKFNQAVEWLKSQSKNVIVFNTICSATRERQKSALELAKEVELMVVIGGLNSANTQKLAVLCRQNGTKTEHIESAGDINPEWFKDVKKVGITAGASTPDWIIREVIDKMMEDLTMEQGLEQGYGMLKEIGLHDIVTGTVVKINNDEVLVDIGGKSEGIIPLKELSHQKSPNIEDIVKVGDTIQVMVIKLENNEGNMLLSKRKVDQELALERLAKIYEDGEVIEAKVVDVVKGGVIVDIGARGFVPASQLDTKFIEDIKGFVGQTLQFKIIEFKPEERKIILSRRVLLEAEEKAKKEALWNEIAEGQTRKGTIQRLANFGAFVDLGGVDGLLHISEMGWGRVKHPSDVVKVGQEVDVYVLAVDREKDKISLGLKQLSVDPWSVAADKYPQGSTVSGKIVRIAPFGAFVELEDGVDGLVHISQISWERVEKVEDALKISQVVDAKVLELDLENKKISLSIKELTERPTKAAPVVEEAEEDIPVVNEEMNGTIGDFMNN